MKYLFVFLVVGLSLNSFGQNRYHIDETTARDCDYGFYPFKCPVVLKTTQKPITGIIYFERSNGEWCESNYRDGKLNGLSRVWYEKDGQLRNEKRYVYGIISGPDKAWHQNGQLWLEYNRMGASEEFHGLQLEWYTNGQLERERTYINGKQDGLHRGWYENGQLKKEQNYKDGKEDGLQRTWFKDGQLIKEVNWNDGKKVGLQRTWFKNGQLIKEVNWKDGRLDGLQRTWFKDGQHNKQKNGQLKYESNYKDGKKISKKCWDIGGNLITCP